MIITSMNTVAMVTVMRIEHRASCNFYQQICAATEVHLETDVQDEIKKPMQR